MVSLLKYIFRCQPVFILLAGSLAIGCAAASADPFPAVTSGVLHMRLNSQSGVYADTAMTIPTGNRGLVAAWADSSGADNHALQSNDSSRPVYLTGVIGGKPVVRFGGIDDFLSVTFTDTLTQPNTFFLVVDTRNYQNEYLFDGIASGARHILTTGSSANPGTWYIGSGSYFVTTPVVQSRFQLHTIVFNGTNTSHYINGILQGVGSGGSNSLSGLQIGCRYNQILFGEFDLAELVIYRNALLDEDRGTIEDFLMNTYSLARLCNCDPDGYPLTDINKDYAIDFEDGEQLAADWLTSAENADAYPPADIDKDCKVDGDDLIRLATDWLTPAEEIPSLRYPALPPDKTVLFEQGIDGINTYRIPSLVTTNDGTVLAFAEARKISSVDKTPTKLVVRRRLPGQTTWSSVQTVRDNDNNSALMDPCAVVDRDTGRVWLFHARYPEGWSSNPVAGLGLDSCTVWITYSDDNGQTWSTAINITAQVKLESWTNYNLGPGIGIQTAAWPYAGRLIIPCSHGGGTTGNNHIIYSDDHGAGWQIGGYISAGSESQVLELSSGVLLDNIRNGGIYGRRYSYSYTYGLSWSSISYDPQLVEPVCQASILRLTKQGVNDKNRILFSNPASSSERVNMTVRMSYDEGDNWPVAKKIHSGPSGYSCLTVLPDKRIGCLYEGGDSYYYQTITYAEFSLEWLTDEADTIYE